MTAPQLAALFRRAARRARASRFFPPPRYSTRRPGGLAWVREAPGKASWTARPFGGCPTRLRRLDSGAWEVVLLPLFPKNERERVIPRGTFPTLHWALHSVSPGAAHRFERPAR